MNYEIESPDVIRLIQQFLKENNLTDSLKELQRESGVTLNTVDNVENFASDIRHGRWDLVLAQTSTLNLPKDKLAYLYEHVVLELLEVGERDLAKEIVATAEPLQALKSDHPERYLRLEHFCKRPYFNPSDAYEMGSSKELRKQEISDSLVCEVSVVPPSRLLSLLGQALRHQQAQGLLPQGVPYDLFRGGRKTAKKDVEEKIPKKLAHNVELRKNSTADSLMFAPDGQSLITGCNDGYIEVWDYETGKLRLDLEYQEKNDFMAQDGAVLCQAFSRDGDHLVTGSQSGQIKVWKLSTGACLRKFLQAHPQGVTSVCFARDGTQVLSTSFDQTARIHGLKSGKALKEFRGHTSYVNCAVYLRDSSSNILTGSADGTIKLWDIRSTECLLTFRPGVVAGLPGLREISVLSIQPVPSNAEQILVTTRSTQAFLLTIHGQLVRTFSSGTQPNSGGDFLCSTISPQGKWLYCVGEDSVLYVFDVRGGQLEGVLTLFDKHQPRVGVRPEVIAVSHHPHRNLVATVANNGVIQLWKP